MKKMIEELRTILELDGYEEDGPVMTIISRLSRHAAKVEEPLAVLADRKGWYVQDILPPIKACPGWEINLCSKEMNKESVYDKVNCDAPTYAECEAKARAYLEGLDGVKGGR